jgi:two-component system, LytTR family, sensor histidine kinase AlgZ
VGLWLMLFLVGGFPWSESLLMAAVLSLAYAFVCRSSRYICTALPLRGERLARSLLVNLMASLVAAFLWVLLAWILSLGLLGSRFTLMGPGIILYGAGVFLYLLSAAFFYLLQMQEQAYCAEQQAHQNQLLKREAEVRALRAQLHPHFLFNSLTALVSLIGSDTQKARQMCLTLAEFLRSSLKFGTIREVSLQEELALIEQYLSIEKIRFGERLQWQPEVPQDCLEVKLPPLLLQPLVENAIKHGISHLLEGGRIKIGAKRESKGISIWVENGYDPETDPAMTSGIGLGLTEQRLRLFAGEGARLKTWREDRMFRVLCWLPNQEGR